jgi:membrane fusion protein, copper/silver efflux system
MFARWMRWIRRTVGLLLLAGLGVAVGMAIRAWVVPHLPAPLAHLVGVEPAGEKGEASAAEGDRPVAFWKSSMIPNFVSPRPGVDPMGMDLIPVYRDQLGQEKLITLSHETMHNIGLRTTPVVRGTAERVVRTVGRVDYAEPLLGDVTLKVGGWVEDLMVDYVGQRVKKGQPLFSLYSPDLVIAQAEYLLDLSGKAGGANPLGMGQVLNAHDRLRYWDVPESELARVKRAGRPSKALTFVSPFDGWVIEKHAFRGMHMKPGTRFYRIADLTRMWVDVYIYEFQQPWVRAGQEARLTLPYDPGQVLHGKVDYVYPSVDPHTRQIRVRLKFPNTDLRLKPEMYANVEIATNPKTRQLLVPLDAVIYNGQHRVIDGVSRRVGYAYVQIKHGRFEPREVVLGEEAEGGQLQVLSGVKEGEPVVVSGQFQLDSERKVKEANLKMLAGTASGKTPDRPPPGHQHH